MRYSMPLSKMKASILTLLLLSLFVFPAYTVAQESLKQNSKGRFGEFIITSSFLTPLEEQNSFKSIGTILSLNGEWGFRLKNSSYMGIELGASLLIPSNGGNIPAPQILPRLVFEFPINERFKTNLKFGQIYHSSLGTKFETEMLIKPLNKGNLTGFLTGVAQRFDPNPDEVGKNPLSWVSITGLTYVKSFENGINIITKAGIGAFGDTAEKTKFTFNGSMVLNWEYISIVGSYTNTVPVRGFPRYFVPVLEVDVLKLFRKYKKRR